MIKKFLLLIVMMFFSIGTMFTQQNDSDYYVNDIEDDFIGVYLPVEYINVLKATRNHSIAMNHNDKRQYYDILMLEKNKIWSNAGWHDGYAIKANEGNLFKYVRSGNDRVVIDNNGYSYNSIGNDLSKAYETAAIFAMKIVFESLINKNVGVFVLEDKIIIPFLYFFTGVDIYTIELDEVFMEDGASAILRGRGNRQLLIMLYMVTNGVEYEFYEEKESRGPYSYKTEAPFFQYNINDDREVLVAASGLGEIVDRELSTYLSGLTDYQKRKIINAMFALNGYSFATKEWQDYFRQYSWYRPDKDVKNDRNILNDRQQRLLDYLNR